MKVYPLHELAMIAHELRADGCKIVHAHGVFDLLHIGHIQHLKAAKGLGSVLIVTVTADRFVGKGPGRPRFTESLRIEAIAALECVDYVALNESNTAAQAIMMLWPHIFAKGVEYRDYKTPQIIEEEEAVAFVKGKIVFTGGVECHSTELIPLLEGADHG